MIGVGLEFGTHLGTLRQHDPTLFTNQQKVQILPIVDDDAFKVDYVGCVRDEKCGNQIDAYMTGFTSFEGQWLSSLGWLMIKIKNGFETTGRKFGPFVGTMFKNEWSWLMQGSSEI